MYSPETDFVPAIDRENMDRLWLGQMPEAIIIASSSRRKALMLFQWMRRMDRSQNPEFVPPDANYLQSNPLTFQETVEQTIRNGDNELADHEVLFLGYLRGVPVLMHPQRGETDGNEPGEESQNKINSIKAAYEGKDVIFIASDTIGTVGVEKEALGKPSNMAGFPKTGTEEEKTAWIDQHLRWGRFFDQEGGQPVPVEHVNVVILERPSNRTRVEKMTVLSNEIPHDQEFVSQVPIFRQSGVGGINQNLMGDWGDFDSLLERVSDQAFKRLFHELDKPELSAFFLMFHFMGVPAFFIPSLLDQLVSAAPTE